MTDQQLDKLKEALDIAMGMDEEYRFLNLNMHDIRALISRLEAAERRAANV